MKLKSYNVYFFFAVLILAAVVVFFMLKPIFIPFILAAILAHTFHPLYRLLLRLVRFKWLSSLMTCLIVALIIFIPVIVFLGMVVNEIQNGLAVLAHNPAYIQEMIGKISDNLSSLTFVRLAGLESKVNPEAIVSLIKSLSGYLLPLFQITYNGIGHFLFVSLIMFFSLFYLLVDGDRLIKKIMLFSPLKNSYEKILIGKFNSMSSATIKGQVLLGIIQGVLGGIIFWINGVSSPVLLGILMVFTTVVPAVGTAFVWFPVGVIMIVLGYPLQGITILIFGTLVITPLYNILASKLIGHGSQMHPLLILFSIIGGVFLFGVAGFIIGPIVMAVFMALLEIYSLEFKKQLEEFNG